MTLVPWFDTWRERLRRTWAGQAAWHAPARRAAYGIVFLAVTTLLLLASLAPDGVEVRLGDVAPADIAPPREVENRAATKRAREERARLVNPFYDLDANVSVDALQRIGDVFRQVRLVRADASPSSERRVASLKASTQLELLDPVWSAVLAADELTLGSLEATAREIVGRLLAAKIHNEADAAQRRLQAENEARSLPLAPSFRAFLTEVVKPAIRPNVQFNEQETRRIREAAMSQQPPVMVQRGQLIVRKGERVSQEQFDLLRDAGLIRQENGLRATIGAVLLGTVWIGLVAAYLVRFRPEVWRSERRLLLLGVIGVTTLMVSQTVGTTISPLLAPLGAASILVAILFEPRLAVLMTLVLTAFLGVAGMADMPAAVALGAGGVVGAFAVRQVAQRSDIWRAGVAVGLVQLGASLALRLVGGLPPIAKDPGYAFLSGLGAGIIAIGSLPFFENYFGMLTHIKLLELSNPNQPLLRRLLLEAPGTYHHSLMVANLCEAAAEEIGADPLLARVGAYYHDIGKMKRPYFFADNQFGGENPHDKLSPHLSALIITSHVKDGLELAREHRLPEEIIDFIPQHHGTNLVSYFYNRAAEEAKEVIPEDDFRYEGPKPRSREAAIMMLADAAEAMSRSTKSPTPEKLEQSIRKIIQDRLADGQLNEADLTLRDLETIARVFVRVLSGAFHTRIEYPQPELQAFGRRRQEARARLRDGSTGQG